MIVIYSKQKDEFVNNTIDYLLDSLFFRVSKGDGFYEEVSIIS